MDIDIHQASPLRGALTIPPDKSICHRAVLLAALAEGETEISPWPAADDCQRTLELVRRLGVQVTSAGHVVRIHGRAGRFRAPVEAIDCGESGTTLRLAAGVLAAQPATAHLCAGPLLSRRPMRRIVEPLSKMGARLEGVSPAKQPQEVYPPLTIHGARPLRAIRYELRVASAQVKSAILLAGLFADGRTTVVERERTRDHTERMLRSFGVQVGNTPLPKDSVGGHTGVEVSVEPGALISPGSILLPGDFSSAAFFIVGASCVPGSRMEIHGVGLNPTRIKLLEMLSRMGASISFTATGDRWEPTGSVVVEARALHGIILEPGEAPALIDELPILMVAAACASGLTRLCGVGELRVKETDRIQSMVQGLSRLGARIRLTTEDTIEIEGGRLAGAALESAGDHRTAMSLAVAALTAEGRSTLRGAECIAKSYPEFFDQLRLVTGSATVKTVDNV